jgi:imidazolonepropionase-like amidohydrolase
MFVRTCRWILPLCLLTISVVAFAFWISTGKVRAGEPRYFAIRDARIVPVSGPVIERGTVVVADGLIKSVGAGDAAIPPEAWVIDGKGLTVYPGLIDAGTDVGLGQPEGGTGAGGGRRGAGGGGQEPRPPIAMGPEDRPATTPWRDAADELKLDDKRIETWRNAGFTTALAEPKDGIFTGRGAVIDLAGERASEMVVKAPAALDIAFQPLRSFFSFPSSLMGVVAYVRQVFIDSRWYAEADPIYEAHVSGLERPPYDRTERVLRQSLQRNTLVLVPANNQIQILRGLRLIQEWGLHAALYGGQQGYAVTDAIAGKRTPILISLKWPEKEKDADPDAEESLRELRFRDRASSTQAAFAKAGVKFAFYSDGLSGPKDIQKNVKKALDAGLPADAALRAFTLDAADILGVSDRLGSIEPGKIANLVVTDGDIFGEKTKVKEVFVDGKRFEIHEAPPEEKPGEKGDKKPEIRATGNAGTRGSARAAAQSGGSR